MSALIGCNLMFFLFLCYLNTTQTATIMMVLKAIEFSIVLNHGKIALQRFKLGSGDEIDAMCQKDDKPLQFDRPHLFYIA